MSDRSWTLKQTFQYGTAAGNFGESVAIDTGHIVVGAPGDNQVYFFNQASQGTSWGLARTFTGPAGFGGGVALYSTYAMVRSRTVPAPSNVVRFYNRGNNGVWEEVDQGIPAPTNAQIASIAIDANFAVAGDVRFGRFYFYRRQNGIWNYVQPVDSTTIGPISMSSFSTISISKNFVLGADISQPGRGIVLSYSAGKWYQFFDPGTITYSNPVADVRDVSSAVSGRFFAISDSAAETINFYDAIGTPPTLKTSTRTVQLAGGYGNAIDMDGNWFIAGADASFGGNGFAEILYKNKNGDWSDGPTLSPPQNVTRFGSDVSISGTQAVVGADGNGLAQGAVGVYVYSSR